LIEVVHNGKALAMWRYSVFRLPDAAAIESYKSSWLILLLSVIRLAKPKLRSEQKAENIFVAPPSCQTGWYRQF